MNKDYRPKVHFSPQKGWMNDPNGLFYKDGEYHLFYQCYPNDTKWGPMHWGHGVSNDLSNWERLPIALYPDELGTIFSGSAVCDIDNTSKLGSKSKQPTVLIFTHDGKKQKQSIAYSIDDVNYIKYKDNPVIKNPGIKDFRDPKVIWNEKLAGWTMVVAAGNLIFFYFSENLIDWNKTGEFESEDKEIIFECPDLIELGSDEGKRWVLITSIITKKEGNKTIYFIGEFNGYSFKYDNKNQSYCLLDQGPDNYAAVSFFSRELEEKIILGWASNWEYSNKVPTKEYRGIMTLPRKLSLKDTKHGMKVAQKPIIKNFEKVQVIDSKEFELLRDTFVLVIEAENEFEIEVSNKIGEKIIFGRNKENEIYSDRSNSGQKGFSKTFYNDKFSKIKCLKNCKEKSEIIFVFDVSIFEIFADYNTISISSLVYPTKTYDKINIKGDNVVAILNYLQKGE